MSKDRVGLGWRSELAAEILSALDRIDVLEVIGDDYVRAAKDKRRALKFLARQVPLHIHGIGLGMAGAEEVATKRLDALARLINEVEPEAWSEHLAFVRAGGIEIGHLAAPPRNEASIAATARNLKKARQIVGGVPMMENIATLIEPPCSSLPESIWLSQIAAASECPLLLDLHNVYANATNFSFDPLQFLLELPLSRVGCIHIAGGRWISSPDGSKQYLLDDHLHGVPEHVYELVAEVAARTTQPLTVILERDGAFPPMPVLLRELELARNALQAGRSRAHARPQAEAHAG
jgi:uncharacterized protein